MAQEFPDRAQDQVFSSSQPVTQLLERWRVGDRAAQSTLVEAIYPYMRNLANANLRRFGVGLAQSTELAHEAFIRLDALNTLDWKSRAHFLAVVASVTRNVVIDLAREQSAQKRGAQNQRISLEELDSADEPYAYSAIFDWIALDQALTTLAGQDKVCADVAEAKLFSSMEVDQIAEALAISPATIGRHWRFAKTWLVAQLNLDVSALRE